VLSSHNILGGGGGGGFPRSSPTTELTSLISEVAEYISIFFASVLDREILFSLLDYQETRQPPMVVKYTLILLWPFLSDTKSESTYDAT
jgi:hypothetical protein